MLHTVRSALPRPWWDAAAAAGRLALTAVTVAAFPVSLVAVDSASRLPRVAVAGRLPRGGRRASVMYREKRY